MKKLCPIFILLCIPVLLKAQWQQLNMPTNANILSSSFVSDNEGWIGTPNSGSYAIIFHTADGGTTWNSDTITGASGGTSYLEFVNSDLGFAVVNAKAFRTLNAGGTWTEMTLPGTAYYEPYFLNEDTGFISGVGYYEYMFKTVDGGDTWNPVYVEPGEGNPFNRINFLNDSVGIATANDETAYTTTDGGDHWNLLYFSTFEYYTSACYSKTGAQFIAGYTDNIMDFIPWILANQGWSISYYYDQCYLHDIASFENSQVYAAGKCGRVVYTEDDGYQWIDTTLTNSELTLVDGIHDIYIFGNWGKGFKKPSYCAATALFTFTASDLDVNFIDQSTSATSWSWDFDDGTTSTDESPVHAFPTAGAYDVCLSVTSPTCGSDTLCYTVIVCEGNTSQSFEGTLDTTFADEGLLIDSVGGYYWYVNSLLIQADGKILATNAGYYSAITRYNTDGTRDSSFSDDGLISDLDLEYGARIALAPDSKIVIGGGHDEIEIIRYNPDGSIDSSFDGDGILINDISQISTQNHIISMVYQPDGKLLVFGIGDVKANVARFNVDGSLDLTFATDGIFNSEDLIGNNLFGDMILQDDGKIVIGASNAQSSSYYYLVRINANGIVDASFGVNGVMKSKFLVSNDCWDYLYSILRQPDGKYLAIGTGTCDYAVHNYYSIARFKSDGTIDSSFAYSGRDTFQIASLSSHATDAILQVDGKILITGYYGFDPYNYKIGLLRLNEDATLDSTFGNYGIVSTSIDCGNTHSYAIALDNDKIYVGGSDPSYNFLIARYQNGGCPQTIAGFDYSVAGTTIQFTDQSISAASWSWDFGDGSTSISQNPSHTYTAEGSYNVCLTATDSCGSDTLCETINVCNPLNTSYLYTVTGLSVQMLNQIAEADSFYWDFGDGSTSTLQNPLHAFSSPGSYHVCLTEYDACTSDTSCMDIVICGTLNAGFSYTQNGNAISFTDASSDALSLLWDFGDGNFSSVQNPTHTYTQAGTYNVCLTVNGYCSSDTFCSGISISASCNASFILVADTSQQGFYYGYNLATGDNLTYYWTWGDGSFSTGWLPTHQYADSGFYTICQMILDTISLCADTFCADYTIQKPASGQGMHEIVFVDYPLNAPSPSSDEIEWNIYPNPFSSTTTIEFTLDEPLQVSIKLFSVDGKEVKMIIDENLPEGSHHVNFNREVFASGIYYLQLSAWSSADKTSVFLLAKNLIIE